MSSRGTQIITLDHGSGGRLTHDLIEMFTKHFSNNSNVEALTDSAVFDYEKKNSENNTNGNIAFTTDSYVINPLHFPGGDIGKLAVCGTVNDLSVSGAVPKYLSCSFIIEEGLQINELEKIVKSMAKTAKDAAVSIVTGDTKVVEKGACDKLFINTSGVGFLKEENRLIGIGSQIQEGDKIIVNGNIADHGLAVLSIRNSFENNIESDCACLNDLCQSCLDCNNNIHFMRDATRGGVAGVLVELAEKINLGIEIDETAIPIQDKSRGLCEMLGFDPLYLANEGKVIMVVGDGHEDVLKRLQSHALGRDAKIIGTVTKEHPSQVIMNTEIGGRRIIEEPIGIQLPRIC